MGRFGATFNRLGLVKPVNIIRKGQNVATNGEVTRTTTPTLIEAAVLNMTSSELKNDTTGLLSFDSRKFYFDYIVGLKEGDEIAVVGGHTYGVVAVQPRAEGDFEVCYGNIVKRHG